MTKKEYMKQWREINKEKRREYAKKWRTLNKDRIERYQKEYLEKNRERISQREKKYRQSHIERRKELLRAWYLAHRDTVNEYQRKRYWEKRGYSKGSKPRKARKPYSRKLWGLENREHIREYNKRYRLSHPEILEQWRQKNIEKIKVYHELYQIFKTCKVSPEFREAAKLYVELKGMYMTLRKELKNYGQANEHQRSESGSI